MTAADEEAEDLAQEAFVRAWRSIGSFRSDSAFRTWMFGIAINVSCTHRVRRGRLSRFFHPTVSGLPATSSNAPLKMTGSRDRWRCAR